MQVLKARSGHIYLMLLTICLILAAIEYGGLVHHPGALLMTLVFWATLIQGCVAVVAAAELIDARWIASLRRELLAVHPLLLFLALVFALLWPQLDRYPWAEAPGLWLNKPFFFLRNLATLLLTFITARLFARSALARAPARKLRAGLYLLVFVTSQSLLAFDLVMSLEYPWYSTLFGAYFAVEALYAGFALAGLSFFFFRYKKMEKNPEHLRDLALLLFGFSVLWAGLFYTQFLLLWYGNLPEEVGFILKRITNVSYLQMAWGFLLANFLVPFVVLISRRAKGNIYMVAGISAVVLAGIFVEKLLYILPALPLHPGALLLQNLLIAAGWLLTVSSNEELLPSKKD